MQEHTDSFRASSPVNLINMFLDRERNLEHSEETQTKTATFVSLALSADCSQILQIFY